jgi:hypothetical protein
MRSKSEYIPGVCNIGLLEIKRRSQTGWSGLGATIIPGAVLFLLRVHPAWRLLLFFPAVISAVGFFQAGMRFCAAFGMRGVFNFGPEVGRTETVDQAEYRLKDRKKSIRIILYSIMIGIAVAVICFVI